MLGALEESDVDTLMRIGTRQQLHTGDKLLTEGTHPDAIYLVLEGELSVSVEGRNTAIAYVGKGEILGEMSFLESQPASATVCAITPVTVLRIPCDSLGENLATDAGFSLRFHRALAMLLSHRVRAAASPSFLKLRPVSELVPWLSPDLTDMSKLFVAACRRYQGRPAYRVDGKWITYADCKARVSRIAASLQDSLDRDAQATAGQPTIAVLLPNSHARHIFHENQLHFEGVGKLLANEHVTIVKLVPSMLQLMCGSDTIKSLQFPDLRWILTGGAAPDPALVRRVATLFDCDLIQGFGLKNYFPPVAGPESCQPNQRSCVTLTARSSPLCSESH